LAQFIDSWAEEYDLEKIKAIGDCYMPAAEIPGSRPDDASVIVHFALDTKAVITEPKIRRPTDCGLHQHQFRPDGHRRYWPQEIHPLARRREHRKPHGNRRDKVLQITGNTFRFIKDGLSASAAAKTENKGHRRTGNLALVGRKAT
jgi:adenylate cyclase